MPDSDYDRNVFVNCPFDGDFRPILESILFALVDSDLLPRIATERLDAENRLEKIVQLIAESRYSIHDLSRVRVDRPNDFARLNMPFELGIDYGFSRAGDAFADKRALVIASDQYDYQAALSDIAGFDIASHGDDYQQAIKHVRSWLHSQGVTVRAPSQVVGDYTAFQVWDNERLLALGWQVPDMQDRSTPELLQAMREWVAAGRPETEP